MKKINIGVVTSAKITNIFAAGLMATSGIMMMILPNLEAIKAQRILFAVVFLLACGTKLLGFFSNDLYRLAFQFDFATGAFCGILAMGVFFWPESTFRVLHIAVIIYVILDGLLKLQIAMDAYRFGMRSWIGILISSICMCLVAGLAAFGLMESLMPTRFCVGAVLTFNGIQNVWITAHTVRIRAQKKNRAEEFGLDETTKNP